MVAFGYAAAALMGIMLGLIGAGGSILTVPVLIYLFHIPVHTATIYSLFIVGITALSGAVGYVRNGWFSMRTLLVFGIPSVVSIYITRAWLLHAIPEEIFITQTAFIKKDTAILLLFAVLMITASYSMIRKSKVIIQDEYEKTRRFRYLFLFLLGTGIGIAAGILGAGGGFLIIPALVILADLPMKLAIGTSLTVIALNSIIGFAGDLLYCTIVIDWNFLIYFSLIAIAGTFAGMWISKYVSGTTLKPAFGIFILLMGLFIITKELMHF